MVFGELDPTALDFLKTHQLSSHLRVSERFPASELNPLVRGAHGLLLIIGTEHRTALSAKLFDYLQARRPILGIGPANSSAAQLIDNAHVGIWAEGHDAIVDRLSTVAATGIPYTPNDAAIRPYSADMMAERTAQLLDRVVDAHNR